MSPPPSENPGNTAKVSGLIAGIIIASLLFILVLKPPQDNRAFEPLDTTTTITVTVNTSVFLEKIPINATKEQVDGILTGAAVFYSQPDVCSKVSRELRDLCYYKVAASILNASICGHIGEARFEQQCVENVYDTASSPSLNLTHPIVNARKGDVINITFTTNGVDELLISPAFNSRLMLDKEDGVYDLSLVSLSCDNDEISLESFMVDSGGVFGVPDYACEEKSSLSVRVVSSGRMGVRLGFGVSRKNVMVQV